MHVRDHCARSSPCMRPHAQWAHTGTAAFYPALGFHHTMYPTASQKGRTPLMLACRYGHADVAEALIVKGKVNVEVSTKVRMGQGRAEA